MKYINLFKKYKFHLIIVIFLLWVIEEKLFNEVDFFKYIFVLLMYSLAWIPIIEIKITGANKNKLKINLFSALIMTILITGFVLG